MHASERLNLLDFGRPQLEALLETWGERRFRARQLMTWIHRRGVADFEQMTDIGKGLRARLAARAEVRPPVVKLEQRAADGTRKWLLTLSCGNAVETVFIPEGQRGTLCVSSQVGCSLNCRFCATATQGFNRNLTAGEIIGQLWVAQRRLAESYGDQRAITNVVLMGMGEPLMNFDNVMVAVGLMNNDLGYGIGKRRVTLSTAGLVPGIERLGEHTDISLAISLHAPNNALRDVLVPLNRKYPIEQLIAACRRYLGNTPHRRITVEYVMLDGVNDSLAHARELTQICRQLPCKVNLIPFNVFPGTDYRRSADAVIDRFHGHLLKQGLTVTTRKTRGDDIEAACGQLQGQFVDRTRRRLSRLRPATDSAVDGAVGARFN